MFYVSLQGIEDYMGDMDFKMTGTKKGITALQVGNGISNVFSLSLSLTLKHITYISLFHSGA